MQLDPLHSYIRFAANGDAVPLAGGAEFWSLPAAEMERLGRGWLLSEYEFTSDWPTWEMHPNGDECVYLLSGSVELWLEQPSGVQVVAVVGTGAVVIPRGVWHTAKIHTPCRMLHVTLGAGTQTRPCEQHGT